MSDSKILIIQNCAKIGDKKYNFKNIENLLTKHIGKKFDLIILPELFAIGWKPEAFIENAETVNNSETLCFLANIAKEFNSNVIGGSYILKENDNYTNSSPFIDRNGNLIAQYAKMHLFSHFLYNEGKYLNAGEHGVLINSDIGKIGLTVCYDIRFCEIYRAYAYAGADLLVNVAAWPKYRENHWKTLSTARAIENESFVIAVSQCGHIFEDEYNLGCSRIILPNGDLLTEAGGGESTLTAEIDLGKASELKQSFPILKDRKLQPYEVKEFL